MLVCASCTRITFVPVDTICDNANSLECLQWTPMKLEPEESLKEASQYAKSSTRVPQPHNTPHTTHTKKRKESQPNPRNKQKQQTCMLQYIPFHSITSRGMTSCSCTKPQLLEPQLHTGQPMKFISGSLWGPVWGPYWPAYDVHIREPMRSSMKSILASLWSPY